MSTIDLIDQRINAAVCNGKSEVHAALIELKAAIDAAQVAESGLFESLLNRISEVAKERDSARKELQSERSRYCAAMEAGGHVLEALNQKKDLVNRIRQQRDEAKAEIAQLKAKLAHEDEFSAFQIDKRIEAEGAADQLRLRLDEATRQLDSLYSNYKIEAAIAIYAANIAHHGICLKDGESVMQATLRKAGKLISGCKEVAK